VREREVKLAAPPTFRMPELGGDDLGFVSVADPPQRFKTTYFDTGDLRLARWGCSLRFRTGEGWTVKLPAEEDGILLSRGEYTFEGDPGAPPGAAVDLVRAYVRSARLLPSARLHALRKKIRLSDLDGRSLGEVVDDEVSVFDGRRLAARFREVEFEAGEASDDMVVAAVVDRLRRAGAGAPDPVPKYVRAVGPRALDPPELAVVELGPDATVGEVVQQALTGSVIRLLRHDVEVRLGQDPEGVHQARVACRRFRSDLRTFSGAVDPEWAAALSEELKWLAGALGRVRDADVLLEQLRADARLVGARKDACGPVFDRLERRRRESRTSLLASMAEERYVALLDRLVDAALSPGLLSQAKQVASTVAASLVDGPWKKLRDAVDSLGDPPADEELHAVRIAAKRARYAAEAVRAVAPKRASSFGRAAAGLQDVLGRHQDAIVAREWLEQVGRSPRSASTAYAAGQLAAAQALTAHGTREAWPDAWKAVEKKRPSTWV
jgi:CHAD domain-containing protein